MEEKQINDRLSDAIADKIIAEIRINECLYPQCAVNGALRKALKKKLENCPETETADERQPEVSTDVSIPESSPAPRNLQCNIRYASKPLKSADGYFFKQSQLRTEATSGDFYEIKIYEDNTCKISLRTTDIDRNALRDSSEIMPAEVVTKSGELTADSKIEVQNAATGVLKDKRIYIQGHIQVAFTK